MTTTSPDREAFGSTTPAAETAELVQLRAENDALRQRLTRRRSIRGWLAAIIATLTVLSLVATTVAVWARETVYDTDRFMDVVGPALEDPAFYTALSDYVSDEALTALALEERVAASLTELDAFLAEELVDAIDPDPQVLARIQSFQRPTLASLAPPIASALETRVVAIVDRFILSERFQTRLPELVEQAHRGGVALIRNDLAELPNVYIEGGEVRLNLIPVITEALQLVVDEIRDFLPDVTLPATVTGLVQQGREQVAAALQAELPEDFGQLTLMSQSSLTEAQDAARRVDRLVWVMALVTLLLLALTIAVSPHRRRTLAQLGLGVIAGFVLVMVLVRRLEAAIIAEISNPDGSQAARSMLTELTGSLRNLTLLFVGIALLVSLVAYLVGQPPWITRSRRRWSELTAPQAEGSELDRWVSQRFDLLRLGGIAIAVGVMFLIGLELIPLVVVAVLLGLYLWGVTGSRNRIANLRTDALLEPVGVGGAMDEEPPTSA
jgi:hypothetical protein